MTPTAENRNTERRNCTSVFLYTKNVVWVCSGSNPRLRETEEKIRRGLVHGIALFIIAAGQNRKFYCSGGSQALRARPYGKVRQSVGLMGTGMLGTGSSGKRLNIWVCGCVWLCGFYCMVVWVL